MQIIYIIIILSAIESVITEIDQDPAQAIQNPQNAQTILLPENVETVYEYAKEKYGEKGYEAAENILKAAAQTAEKSAEVQKEQTANVNFYDSGKRGDSLDSVFASLGKDADIQTKAKSIQQWAAGRMQQDIPTQAQTAAHPKNANQNGGLINNEAARTFNVKSRSTLNQIGKELGVQIEFSDKSGIGNGYYENGKIVLSTQSENPVGDILKHELTHYFKQTAPQEYEAYSRYVIDAMAQADPEYLVSELERTKNLYEAYTKESYTEQAVMDEIVSDFTASFADNPEKLLQFVKENRSTAQRIADSLHEIIVKIRSALEKAFGSVKRDLGEAEQYNPYGLALEQFDRAEQLWREALKKTETNKNENSDGLKYSLKMGGYNPDIQVSTDDISVFGIKDIRNISEVKQKVYNYLKES